MPKKAIQHVPVMLEETMHYLLQDPDGLYIDVTFGRGGHAKKILEFLSPQGRLLVIDRDLEAIQEAEKLAKHDTRLVIRHGAFSDLPKFCEALGWMGKVRGLLADLGVSSCQLDEAKRGFSFQKEGPLDMRMDQTSGITAAEWLNQAEEQEIADVLYRYAQERYSRSIAKRIVAKRDNEPFERTEQLASLVSQVLKGRSHEKKHPATRTFQAIRIYINQELLEVEQLLSHGEQVLAAGGVMVIISFHSLEDRLVKQFIQAKSKLMFDPSMPVHLTRALSQSGAFEKLSNAIRPSEEEKKANPRARSAILRAARRTEA